jgi:hypothetical protein
MDLAEAHAAALVSLAEHPGWHLTNFWNRAGLQRAGHGGGAHKSQLPRSALPDFARSRE